jgi:EAL domain-containing protein (putative c-di-GMP-specific phosphodiesterase class I)
MIKIPSIFIECKGKQYTVYPKVELVTDCLSNNNYMYEMTCIATESGTQLCPIKFFSELACRETYVIYRHALESLRDQTTSRISLNMDINFLRSHYVEMLLSEFGNDMIILELSETSSLQSIVQIQDRLNEIRKNPRVRIWLDNFGTERSNFDLINIIDFNGVKISKELFWDLYKNDQMLLKYLIKMMRRKASMVIIEGVDSFEKYVFCKEQQCMMQGHFFNEIKARAAC